MNYFDLFLIIGWIILFIGEVYCYFQGASPDWLNVWAPTLGLILLHLARYFEGK